MDGNSQASSETLPANLAIDLEKVMRQLEIAEGKIMQLELALLQSRDFAIGAAAEAGVAPLMREKYVESERQLGDANAHIESHIAHIQRLEQALADALKLERVNKDLRSQLEKMKSSLTWRIGRLVMLPIRLIKRILR